MMKSGLLLTRSLLLFFLSWGIYSSLLGQSNSKENWETLASLDFEKSQDEYGEIFIPKFGPEIKALAGKDIELEGYIIPFEGMFGPKKTHYLCCTHCFLFFLWWCRTGISS